MHRPGAHHVDPRRRKIHRQAPRDSLDTRTPGCDERPAFVGSVRHGASCQRDRGLGPRREVFGREFGEDERTEEAHVARAMDFLDRGFRDGDDFEGVAGCEDDVVDFGACSCEFEKGIEVGLEGLGLREVARLAIEAGVLVWVGGLEAREGGFEFWLFGAGDGDVGAVFEGCFGHAEADTGCSSED